VVEAFAYAERVTIRVTNVDLANVRRHVGRWESNVQCGHALFVDFVDVVHPNGHPHAVIGCFVSVIPNGPLPRSPGAPWQKPHFSNQAKLAKV
jgi:hypothetical protein